MAVVTVRTLLLTRSGAFVPVESVPAGRRRWHSIEGAIELTVGDTPVLTTAHWDDVGDLWVYIATMVAAVRRGEPRAETSFPDQPVVLRLTRKGGHHLEIRCDTGTHLTRAVAPEDDLLRALCEAGLQFLDELDRLGVPPENFRNGRVVFAETLAGLPAGPG